MLYCEISGVDGMRMLGAMYSCALYLQDLSTQGYMIQRPLLGMRQAESYTAYESIAWSCTLQHDRIILERLQKPYDT